MINGEILAVCDKATINTIMQGEINYLLDSCKVSTLNQGHLGEVCDKSVIATANNGEVTSLRGNATINSLIDASITNKYGDYKILFDKNAKPEEEVVLLENQNEATTDNEVKAEVEKNDESSALPTSEQEAAPPALQLEDETEEDK